MLAPFLLSASVFMLNRCAAEGVLDMLFVSNGCTVNSLSIYSCIDILNFTLFSNPKPYIDILVLFHM